MIASLCLPLLMSAPLLASGGDPLEAALQRLLPGTIATRRQIHANPELGEREFETARLVAQRLRALGLEVRTEVGGTGVVAFLQGPADGPVVAWRADMDALPVVEATGLEYASTKTDTWNGEEVGVMHACGHDVHVAIGLGVAAALADPGVRPSLRGSVLFLFQPAEEGVAAPGVHGAERMLAEGAFDEHPPSAVFGLHVNPRLAVGEVGLIPGGALAAVDRFRIHVKGRQVHGAYPHDGVDPIVAASHLVLALQTIASRNVDTRDKVVVTVGSIHGGNRFNIIPGGVDLVGTIRTHDGDIQDLVHRRMGEIVAGVAAAHGAEATIAIERMTPVTWNDPALMARLRPHFESALQGVGRLATERPHMGGEDFAFFAMKAPGLFFFLGVAAEGEEKAPMVHTPEFAPDERAIGIGMGVASRILIAALRSEE